MKIRIKGASIRIRLSKTEVAAITTDGYLEERTPFPGGDFIYALSRTQDGTALGADFTGHKLVMTVPQQCIAGWADNQVISIESRMRLDDGPELHLLLEKDFQCLDRTDEDQSDNYTNPNKNC